ncbi:MAG: hypothetical protein WB988_02970 [Candidatus Nitrosopolaris sp.]
MSILQPLICFVRDITFSPSSLMKNDYMKQKISLENLKVKMYIDESKIRDHEVSIKVKTSGTRRI